MASEEEVRVVESCFVTPAADTPSRALRLSPLDLMLVHGGYTPVVHFYRPRTGDETTSGDFFDVTRLKTALSMALVPFYPLAGRFKEGVDGRMEIDCNGKGMLFLVAHSRLAVDDFSNFEPSPKQRRLFVPHIDGSAGLLCAIQVTFLKCGSVVLGMATHHGALDGTAMFHFLQTWTAFSRDGDRALVNLPCHDRSRLYARDPPVVHPDALSVFCPKMILSQTSIVNKLEVFTVRKDHLSTLKLTCGGVSTFSALTAHTWQCMCLARRLPPDSTTRLAFMANVRRRMTPPLPDGYFGNAIININVAEEAQSITSGDLAFVARRIKDTITRVDDELVHSAVDYVELALAERDNRHTPAMGNLPVTDIRVVNWLGLPLYDLDFSWGKPLAVMRAESSRGGLVHLMNSTQGDGSVQLVIYTEAAILTEFKRLFYAKFDDILHSKF
ncbi:hydroxycinnamoyltransferase 4-like [Triticum dicoccoides]|uniref:hydroxycinnamoyltransferase 4-like n=1 Tax=Triticum dicoccoides TaxID=85692 RepID=UPI001890BF41|nr:hydroxycinnamoyltransferase 4-like [Triticum dicoccoides]